MSRKWRNKWCYTEVVNLCCGNGKLFAEPTSDSLAGHLSHTMEQLPNITAQGQKQHLNGLSSTMARGDVVDEVRSSHK
jgi:hypothetical protein